MALTADEIVEVRAIVHEELVGLKLPAPTTLAPTLPDGPVRRAVANLEAYLRSLVARVR